MTLRFTLTGLILCLALFAKAQVSSFPYNESWEAGGNGSWTQSTSDDFDWTNNTGGTTSSSTGPTSASDGANYLYTETSGSSNGDIAIIENDFDFSSLSAPQLIFDYHMYFDGASNGGTLDVDVSTNGGTTWTNEWTKSGDQGNQWNVFEIVDLSSYGNQSGVKVRFHFTVGQNTSFQNDCAIDDIIVQQQPSCPRPLNLRAKTLQAFNAVIGWDTVAAATNGYEVIYGTSGFDPATGGTSLTTTADSASLTGLSSATDYDFYVIADCGSSNGISDTAGPATFRTLCAGFSAPYSNNFDNGIDGQIANCWAQWNSYDNSAYARVESSPFGITPASGSNVLEMYSWNGFNSTDTLAAVSPQFTDMTAGDKQIEFKAAAGDATNDIYVGTTNSQAPGSSVTYIDTVTFNTTGTFQTVRISLDSANGYNGTDEYIVLEHSLGGTFDDLWIDDFKYQVIPPCPDPFRFSLVSITDTSGTITFDHPDSTFNYNWGPCGFTQGSTTSSFASGAGNPFTAGGLTPSTCYDIYVQADCSGSGNGTSGWAGPFSFRTQCSPFTAPYSQNFDGTTEPEVDPCWNTINTTGASSAFAGTENFRSNSAPNSIELYNQSATSGDLMLVSPAFSDLDSNKRISFWVNDDDDDSDLLIGTMSDFVDPATFTAFDTITAADMDNDTWDQFVIDMTGYSGTDKHIAFKHGLGSTFDNIYIDDFKYNVIPLCDGPLATTLGTTSITANSAGVFWGSSGQGDTTKVVWGSSGFDPNTTRLGIGFTSGTDTTFNITGLSPQTTYDFYIQDSCAVGGAGTYVGPFTFTTACLPVTAPFTENFDNTNTWSGTTLDPCWTSNGPGGFAHQWEITSGTTTAFGNTGPNGDNTSGSGQYIYTETSSSSPTNAVLTTPLVDVSSLNKPYISFFYHRYGSSMGDLKVDINDGSGWTNIITLRGQDQQAKADPWKEIGAEISTFGDTVQIRFTSNRVGFEGDGAIDDFSVDEAPSCPKVVGLSATNVSDTSGQLSWVGTSNATDYQVWFGRSGFFQGTQTVGGAKIFTGSAAQDSLIVDTLTGNTCYEYLVRGICQPGDTSEWVGPFTFCTPCTPFSAPYLEDFDAVNTGISGDFGNCWQSVGGTTSNYSWRSNSGTTGSASTGPSGDATTGSGVYLYTEASSGGNGDTATLLSPIIDISGLSSAELRYAYHTYGSNIDTILVEVFDGTTWNLESKIGEEMSNESDAWKVDTVDLSAYSGNIRVRYRLRSNGCCSGDAAIDDFIIEEPVNSDLSLVSANFAKNSLCLSSNDTLVYEVANIKGSSYDLSTDPLVLNYDISGPINSIGSTTINSGTINAGDTNSFMITGIDLSTPGSYSLDKAKMDANNFNLSPLNDSIDNADNLIINEVWDVQPDTAVIINNTTDTATLSVNSSLLGGAEDSVLTTPPLTANNGQSGITFEFEANQNVTITSLVNVFDASATSANVWMRTGGVQHVAGQAPNISSANGWTQVVTNGTVTGANGSTPVRLNFGGTTIPIQANQRYGFFIDGDTEYQTGTAGDQTTYTDGTISVIVDDDAAYGGGAPTPTFNPRRFLGGVVYERPSVTPGFNWTLNGNVIDTLPETVVGPYTSSGVYNYVATLNNSPCGSFTDTVTVIVNLQNQCPSPTGLAATSNVGCDSIEVDWTSNTGSSIIQWGTQGFIPGSGNFTGIVSSPYVVKGLTPGTAYDFWVADTCGGDTSSFTGPVTATTSTGPLPAASFTIDSAITGSTEQYFVDATGSSNADSYSWDFGNGLSSANPIDTASYAANGSFVITLVVSNSCGSDTATRVVDVNIGMEENPISRSFNVYPNPTHGTVNVEFDVPTSSSATVRILDMRGRIVKQRTDNKLNGRYDEQWDLSSLARGMYMIEIESGEMRAQRRLNLR